MQTIHEYRAKGAFQALAIDCASCCGLCCTALFYAKADGFPTDKEAGIPCQNLGPDFRCAVHERLASRGLKGCMAYDCFGAGQLVTQEVYQGMDWRSRPELAEEMFAVFLIIRQLCQMRWYLLEAAALLPAKELWPQAGALLLENREMTTLSPAQLLALDLDGHRQRVNGVLRRAGERVQAVTTRQAKGKQSFDCIGKSFQGQALEGRDFSMSLLIAANLDGCRLHGANFLGADLRDANLENADLRESIFLTQWQINTAKGNRNTRLPEFLTLPPTWR